MKDKIIYTAIAVSLILFFRNENTCSFDKYSTICVSYNRITGQWNIPVDERYTLTSTNHNNSVEAAPAAEEAPAAPTR